MNEWQPAETAPKDGTYINVRVLWTYQWRPYSPKSEQFRKGHKGRWRRATEYGWENCQAPNGEWQATP